MEYQINNILEFGLYPILGILAALVGVVFVKSLYWTEDLFAKWKSVPEWVQPAVGGALLGALALGYPAISGLNWDRIPQVFNVGYDVIEGTLNNQIVLGTVIALLVLKIIATALTLGSGGSGGVFAPSLFMGSMLGSAFGVVVNMTAPFVPAAPGAYALVGMGAVFAAVAHAPITAIIILFELTGDYRIILPLMLTVVVATLFSRKLLAGESIYTLKLSRRGVRIKSGRDVDIMRGVRVDEVMTTNVDTVIHNLTIVAFSEVLSTGRHRRFPILADSGDLLGMVTASDLKRAILADTPRSTTVLRIGKTLRALIVAYPDDTIDDVLQKMGPRGLGRLPVVSRSNPRKLVGMIAREDIVRAYQIALTRRSEIAHRVRRTEMKVGEATEFVEIQLSEGDRSLGATIHEIGPSLPRECVLVSINRNGTIIIPHGDSILMAGDILTVYSRTTAIDSLVKALKG
ncbi:MAG: chloride channel protein [Chloroflexi bacterium]|nr:chloride channel protein [Chloroflexota bacterium]